MFADYCCSLSDFDFTDIGFIDFRDRVHLSSLSEFEVDEILCLQSCYERATCEQLADLGCSDEPFKVEQPAVWDCLQECRPISEGDFLIIPAIDCPE